METHDNVNHPSHYTDGKYEVIDVIESWVLNYHLGNALKYISRAGKKDPDKEIEDLEKAAWYLKRMKDKYLFCSSFFAVRVGLQLKPDPRDYAADKDLPPTLQEAVLALYEGDIPKALERVEARIAAKKSAKGDAK